MLVAAFLSSVGLHLQMADIVDLHSMAHELCIEPMGDYYDTVKPVFKGHCDEGTTCDQGTLSHNGILSSPC